MYYDWIQTHKKTIVITSMFLFSLLIIWGVATYISRTGKIGVTISAVPSDATITIDTNNIGNGTHWMKAGVYTITAKKEGFKTRTKEVEVTATKKQNVVAISLTPESDTAKKWVEANPEAYKKNESYGAIEARVNGEYFRTKHPITNVLPYTDPYYTIGYKSDNNRTIVVTISTPSPRYRYYAVEKFRELGFNPTEYQIEFSNFKSPLGGA